jgi:hypothetical protein
MIDTPAFAWGNDARRLAQWVKQRLVNRTDVYGRYLRAGSREPGKSNNYTAPRRDERVDGVLNVDIVERHFRGEDVGNLIGLHAIGKDNTCRWMVLDIDRHSDADPTTPEANFQAAVGWFDKLKTLGFTPLLLDSNGAGGFHVLLVFSTPAASRRVFDFGAWLVSDFADRGLRQRPEVFPKQPDVNPNRPYGNWWRLPGRHHTRDHWTKVWGGHCWLEKREAVEAVLAVTGDDPTLIPEHVKTPTQPVGQSRPGRVGVGGALNPVGYASPYDDEHWVDILQGREPGGRHEGLLQLAGHLLGRGVHPHVVEELCVCWNERNDPPKPVEVIRQTVQDLVQRDATVTERQGASRNRTTTYRLKG